MEGIIVEDELEATLKLREEQARSAAEAAAKEAARQRKAEASAAAERVCVHVGWLVSCIATHAAHWPA